MNRILPITLIMLIVVGGVALSQDINAQDQKGNTQLHQAVQSGNIAMVTISLVNGADVTIRNNDGETPIEMAIRYHEWAVKQTTSLKFSNLYAYSDNVVDQLKNEIKHARDKAENDLRIQTYGTIISLFFILTQ